MSRLVAAFSRLHDRAPTHPIVHVPAQRVSLTVGDVWRTQRECAAELCAHGLRPGQLLLIATGNGPALIPLLLAARSVGAAILAADSGATATELEELASRFGAAMVCTAAGGTAVAGTRFPFSNGLELTARTGARDDYGDTALLKVTSGSTGVPKAARTTDVNLISDSEHIVSAMGIGPNDTQIAVIPLSHAYGLSVIAVPLLIQGTPIVLRDTFVPQHVPEDALAYGATTFAGVPYMFDYFVSHPPEGGWPPGLRRLISAGARLTPETVRGFAGRFGLKIHSFYGTSESGGISYDGDDAVTGEETVGRPLPGVTITLRPDADTPAGTGRVHVAGAGVAAGYVDEPSGDFIDGGFLTGDYGMFDACGRLHLTGRVSSFINVAGNKVQPAEVEDVLRQMPGVRDVRVLGADDPQRGQQVVACLVADPASADGISTMAVRRFCSSRLAAYKIPRTAIVLDAIPLTARGKTDRRALEARVRAAIDGIPEQLC